MYRRSAVPRLTLLAAVLLLAASSALAAADPPPNIVLLLGDDHGWPYSGFMGDPYVRTPNLDALAAGGTAFTSAHSPSSVCAPALRALLGAVHNDRWEDKQIGLENAFGVIPRRTEVVHFDTLPRALVRHGYLAWEGGKLWEGTFRTAGFTHGLATSVSPNPYVSVGDQFGRENWTAGTALAPLRSFLDEAGGRTFFAWVAPMLPHNPYDAPQEFRTPYEQQGLSAAEVRYYANVSWLDALVGAVVAELDARGLRENTLVVYLSDNGIGIDQQAVGFGQGKGTLYELGFRTPLIFNWPGHVPSGVLRDDVVSALDVPPTLIDFAGADPLTDADGQSIKAAVQSGTPIADQKVVSHYAGSTPSSRGYYVRTPSWRYVLAADGREELYDVTIDPFEDFDVAALHAELLPGFRADVMGWEQQRATAPEVLEAAGRLSDASDLPIAGEDLQLTGHTLAGDAIRLRVRTSPQGDYRFESLPQGFYAVRCHHHAAGLALGDYHDSVLLTLPVGKMGSYMALRALAPRVANPVGSASVGGVLRNGSGQPLGGATITVRGRGSRDLVVVRSAPDGRYRAENLPSGVYRITASPGPGLRHATARAQLAANQALTVDLVSGRN